MSPRDGQTLRSVEPAEPPKGYDTASGFALFSLLRSGHHRLHDLLDRRFADAELTVSQFELLALVRQNPDASQGELAEALSVNRATIVGWVERLVCDGLLTRSAKPPDRRIKRLQLTVKGRRRMAGFERRFDEVMAPFRTRLGMANYMTLVELLGMLDGAGRETSRLKIAESLSDKDAFRSPPRT